MISLKDVPALHGQLATRWMMSMFGLPWLDPVMAAEANMDSIMQDGRRLRWVGGRRRRPSGARYVGINAHRSTERMSVSFRLPRLRGLLVKRL